jgi:diguanylate cyclase (GGDEF)-like protein
MNRSRLILKDAADELPSPNGVALAIMELWHDDAPCIDDIVQLVETDPALSGRLLRLANASGQSVRPAVSIREAISRVGVDTVKQVAVAFSLVDRQDDQRCSAFDYPGFSSHSLLVAMIARHLVGQSSTAPPDDIFACALLARIGCLALATVYPGEYADILARQGGSVSADERDRFGFDHNDLSYELMRDYGVPEPLARPATHHETPEQLDATIDARSFRIAALLHIAFRLANDGVRTGDHQPEPATLESVAGLASDALGIDRRALETRFADAMTEWRQWAPLFRTPDAQAHEPPVADAATPPARADDHAGDAGRTALVLQNTDDQSLIERVRAAGFAACQRDDQEQMLRTAVDRQPDLLVLDHASIVGTAESLLRLIRSTEWGQTSYIVLIADGLDASTQAQLFEAGIDAYLEPHQIGEMLTSRLAPAHRLAAVKALWIADRRDLRRTANQLVISRRKFETLSMTDALTGLPNRRAAMSELDRAWAKWMRDGPSVGIIALDIDHFKHINDDHGHAAGDRMLSEVASVWAGITRQGEILCRSGGEEFLIITTGIDLPALTRIAARLQTATHAVAVEWDGAAIGLSVSMGLAHSAAADDQEALLRDADNALYAAKAHGRDRICYQENGAFFDV